MATGEPPAAVVPPRRPRGRVERLLILLACAFLVAAGARYVYHRWAAAPPGQGSPELPAVDETGLDPAIVQALERERQAVRQTPQSARAWGRLGMVLLAHMFTPQAKTCLAQAERLDPDEPRWPFYQAFALEESAPEAAVPKLQRTVALCGDVPAAPRLRLAKDLSGLDRLDEATEQYRITLRRYPDNAEAYLGLARIAIRRGDLEAALRDGGRAVGDPFMEKAARDLLAQVYQRQGNKAAADKERRRAGELPDPLLPADPFMQEMVALRTGKQAALITAAKLYRRGRDQEVIALMEQTVRAYPDSEGAWLQLGMAYLHLRQADPAERALRRALELAPDLPTVHHHLGLTRLLRNDYPGATGYFRKAVELKPDFALSYFTLAYALQQQGDRPGAIQAFRTYLRYRPDNTEAQLLLCDLLTQEGQHAEAVELLKQAVRANPQDPQTRKLLEQQLLKRIPIPFPW